MASIVVEANTKFRVTCRDSLGALVDLTGNTVTLRFSLNGAAAVEKTMTLEDQTGSLRGQAWYLFLDADLPAGSAGEVRWEVVAVDGTGNDYVSERIHTMDVRERLP